MKQTLKELIRQGETSPYYKLLGIKIDEVKENYARLSLEICKKHMQFLNTIHGGVAASLADSAAAWAILGSSDVDGFPVTIEMKINFLKPVSSGELIAEARKIYSGSRIMVCDVEVKNYENLIAKCLVTYYLIKNAS
ncbi:MAG: PaaI family thioesterase [Candidatus Bathyarchaeia archaeon]